MNDLSSMNVKQLLQVAKELDIKGRHNMQKQVLIDAILVARGPITTEPPRSMEEDLATGIDALWDSDEGQASKDVYIDNAKIGMLIAFKVNDRKALSGKIEEIHQAGFVVKTKNGVKFNVRKKNVMWVKTGNRWPRGVYLALKGEQSCGGHQAAN